MEHHCKVRTRQGQTIQRGTMHQFHPHHVPRPLQRPWQFHLEEPESHINIGQDPYRLASQRRNIVSYTSIHKVVTLSPHRLQPAASDLYCQMQLVLYSCTFHKTEFLSLQVYRTSSAFIVLLQKLSNHTTVFAVHYLCLLAKTMKIPGENLCYHSIIIW